MSPVTQAPGWQQVPPAMTAPHATWLTPLLTQNASPTPTGGATHHRGPLPAPRFPGLPVLRAGHLPPAPQPHPHLPALSLGPAQPAASRPQVGCQEGGCQGGPTDGFPPAHSRGPSPALKPLQHKDQAGSSCCPGAQHAVGPQAVCGWLQPGPGDLGRNRFPARSEVTWFLGVAAAEKRSGPGTQAVRPVPSLCPAGSGQHEGGARARRGRSPQPRLGRLGLSLFRKACVTQCAACLKSQRLQPPPRSLSVPQPERDAGFAGVSG